jgi:hypothetical protein
MAQSIPSPEKRNGGRVSSRPQTVARNPDTAIYPCRYCYSKAHWSNDWNWTDETATEKAWICESHPDEEIIPTE